MLAVPPFMMASYQASKRSACEIAVSSQMTSNGICTA